MHDHSDSWYLLDHPELVDSPAYLVYPERIRYNIQHMVAIAGDPLRLVPHVKTHKMAEPVRMQMEAGIKRFKCATLAEAEMLARSGVQDVILAYQLNPTKALRYLKLAVDFPAVRFSSLIDNACSAQLLNDLCASMGKRLGIWVDLDTGMHRSGIPLEALSDLFLNNLKAMNWLDFKGFHAYDGHIRDRDLDRRAARVQEAIEPVRKLREQVAATWGLTLEIIAGGTPSFPIHAQSDDLLCSPGTCVLWDYGYGQALPEQPFLPAAVVLSRIISKTQPDHATLDLGHKSIAAENPLENRVRFLNLSDYQCVSQSEEHLVIAGETLKDFQVGDVLYGIPFHVCPTTALYDTAVTVDAGAILGSWDIVARKRFCSY